MPFNRDRFKTLVQYICFRSPDPRRLGSVKLNKILWFADVIQFERAGETLTGETYVKRQHGPAPRHIVEVVDELQQEGRLSVRRPELQYEPTLYFATERPNLGDFSADEISLVDEVLSKICNRHTAASISRVTHDEIYDLAQMGEEIPPYAFLASKLGEFSDADLQWGQEAAAGASDR